MLLALVGFGIKAGVLPLHFWLPGAHAAAPSHVSALLSGVMLKMGIYGLLRVLSLLGSPPAWWGWTVLALGLASAVLGVLWALAQHDLKRALAYSSVENIGIIVLGLGLGALGTAYDQPAVALLGFAGALLHTLNHALFKSLLFLGAGAVVHATGTREIDRLGGLARRMPRTALAFLIGSVAIVGLPPLNGFVSEWVVGQVSARGAGPDSAGLRGLGAGLGMVGGLALACFVRVTAGYSWAGRVHPRPRCGMNRPRGSMLALAVLSSGWRLPAIAVRPAASSSGRLSRRHRGNDRGRVCCYERPPFPWHPRCTAGDAAGAAVGLRLRAGRLQEPVIGMTWGCAYGRPDRRMQYTASSFSAPVLRAFGSVAAPRVSVMRPRSHRPGRPDPGQGGRSRLAASPRAGCCARCIRGGSRRTSST